MTEEVAKKLRFWVAQRFQRCDNWPIVNTGFSRWGTHYFFPRSIPTTRS